MKRRMCAFTCALALCMGLLGCGGTGSATTSAKQYDFYSAEVPEGYRESETKDVFREVDGDGSIYVAVFPSTADDLLEAELSSSSYERGDKLIIGGRTWMTAVSDEWDTTYYITDWEDGCIEIKAQDADEGAVEAFLAAFTPAENAYEKWQDAD